MKLRLIAALSCMPLFVGLIPSAAADEWQLVLSDRDRRVEIDRASIFDSDRGTKVSWGRVVLSAEEAKKAGYATIRALNRYDCANRSFFTIKRVYLDGAGRVIREEAVTDTSPVMVARNSVDERMWREVCRPPTVSDLQKVAAAAGRSAAEAKPAEPPKKAAPVAPIAAAPAAATKTPPATPAAAPMPKTPPASPAAAPATPTPAASAKAAVEAPQPVKQADYHPGDAAVAPARDKVAQAPRAEVSGAIAATPAAAPMPPAARAPASPIESAAPARLPAPSPAPQPPVAVARSETPRPAVAPSLTTLSPTARAALAAMTEPKWGYDGDTGPEHWAKMRPDWRICSEGNRQSPVDLREGVAVDLEPVRFDYRSTRFRVVDTGTTLQVNVGEGMGIEVRGRRYELTHFTLHRPSEERVGGRAADMSVHFHHRDAEGRMAVVGVMLEHGGPPNPLLQTIWNNLPLEKGSGYMPAASIDLGGFMPANPAHFLYMGSLVTPPCTEGVLWVVMKTPVLVSDEQLGIFSRLYPRNSRPIQPANGRLILESR